MEINRVKSLKEGSHEMFNLVFETYWEKVYHYLLKRTKDVDCSMELTQQVFIKFWRYRATLSEDITLDEQIFRKSRLVYIDWLRQESRRRTYLAEMDESFDIADRSDSEASYFLKHDLHKAIDALPPKRREIFELKHIHGYSYKEIADMLGISVKTVDNQLLKANTQLRKILHTSIWLVIGEYMINQ